MTADNFIFILTKSLKRYFPVRRGICGSVPGFGSGLAPAPDPALFVGGKTPTRNFFQIYFALLVLFE
jgi:hypothetical protein